MLPALALPVAQTPSPRLVSSSFPTCTFDLLQPRFSLQKSVKFTVAWANNRLQSPALPVEMQEPELRFAPEELHLSLQLPRKSRECKKSK